MVSTKKVVKGTLIALLSGMGLIIYVVELSPRAFKIRKNLKHFRQLKDGMTKNEMLQIMGQPDNIEGITNSSGRSFVYFYQPPFASSGGIEIYLDSNERISRLYYE